MTLLFFFLNANRVSVPYEVELSQPVPHAKGVVATSEDGLRKPAHAEVQDPFSRLHILPAEGEGWLYPVHVKDQRHLRSVSRHKHFLVVSRKSFLRHKIIWLESNGDGGDLVHLSTACLLHHLPVLPAKA